jgi:hypothetical protein
MKDLENFYNNHYKTDQIMDWSELTEKQKNALEKSSEYWKHQLDNAIKDFRIACIKEMEKLIDVVRKFR